MIKTLSAGSKNLPAIETVLVDLFGEGINLSCQNPLIHGDVFAFFAKIIGTSSASAT